MTRKPKLTPTLDLDVAQLSVAGNGYIVDLFLDEDDPSPTQYAFETWEALTTWLFNNMAKPEFPVSH